VDNFYVAIALDCSILSTFLREKTAIVFNIQRYNKEMVITRSRNHLDRFSQLRDLKMKAFKNPYSLILEQ